MSITVKAADAAHFLSLVPGLCGFTPTQSLVLVPMSRGRSLGAMRLDLPPEDADEPGVDAVASTAIGMICRVDEADALVAIVYTDAAIGGGTQLPGAAVMDAVSFHADASGLRLLDALTVASDGWGSHDDPDLPAGGRALADLRARDADAEVLAGSGRRASTGDQSAGAVLPRVGQPARRAVGLAMRSLTTALEVICGIPSMGRAAPRIDPGALEAACELDDLPALFEHALAWRPAESPMRAAMLGWCLGRPGLRDIALVQWATDQSGGDIASDAQRRWEDGEEYPVDLALVMWGDAPRPDRARLESALAVVREVAALLPKKHRPGPLAVCAWLSWALGRSSHAHRYARSALAIDPHHGLADIVHSFVQAGHLPEWAFRAG
ncbi:MAG: DUF4192 family protein [Microbacterium sp.]|uniref:DUF4192 family protein n=1 Tax=Microbacterium sp. TaxID=51671 RepID=UPI001AC0E895|nr:DUF4192 family protein [Microbacterium sp.]MBN9176662.1 DUF4192 family protein [Microbacterium sp.]